jgi:hypothetical protein
MTSERKSRGHIACTTLVPRGFLHKMLATWRVHESRNFCLLKSIAYMCSHLRIRIRTVWNTAFFIIWLQKASRGPRKRLSFFLQGYVREIKEKLSPDEDGWIEQSYSLESYRLKGFSVRYSLEKSGINKNLSRKKTFWWQCRNTWRGSCQ